MKTLIPVEVGKNVNYELRNAREVKPPQTTNKYFLKSYIPSAINLLNNLRLNIRWLNGLDMFKKQLNLMNSTSEQQRYKPYLWTAAMVIFISQE